MLMALKPETNLFYLADYYKIYVTKKETLIELEQKDFFCDEYDVSTSCAL